MGWKFRRSMKILPGIRVNVGSRGVSSFSFGGRGMTVNVNKHGTKTTFSLPRTGISYRTRRSTQGQVAIGQPNPSLSPRLPPSLARKKAIGAYAVVGVLALFTYNALKPSAQMTVASKTLPTPQSSARTPGGDAGTLPLSSIISPTVAAPARPMQAETSTSGRMATTITGANVRSQPSRAASISIVLSKGTSVWIVDSEGDWDRVTNQKARLLAGSIARSFSNFD